MLIWLSRLQALEKAVFTSIPKTEDIKHGYLKYKAGILVEKYNTVYIFYVQYSLRVRIVVSWFYTIFWHNNE